MTSVHDNHLYGYEFDARTSVLVLHTAYPHSSPVEHTAVRFHGVWTHHLESVLGHDILFGIEASDVDTEMKRFGDLFARLQNYGWPKIERKDETLLEVVKRKNLSTWHISSSYGIEGFVVAERMEMVAISAGGSSSAR